jgi:hypothetical protein
MLEDRSSATFGAEKKPPLGLNPFRIEWFIGLRPVLQALEVEAGFTGEDGIADYRSVPGNVPSGNLGHIA